MLEEGILTQMFISFESLKFKITSHSCSCKDLEFEKKLYIYSTGWGFENFLIEQIVKKLSIYEKSVL